MLERQKQETVFPIAEGIIRFTGVRLKELCIIANNRRKCIHMENIHVG